MNPTLNSRVFVFFLLVFLIEGLSFNCLCAEPSDEQSFKREGDEAKSKTVVPNILDAVGEGFSDIGTSAGKIIKGTNEVISERVLNRDVHIWQRYVREFRESSQYSITLGVLRGDWKLTKLGTLIDKNYTSSGQYLNLVYEFHLKIYRRFGYVLGSSFGGTYEGGSINNEFLPPTEVVFPGGMIGLVYNFTPGLRLMVGGEYSLSRLNNIAERDGISSRAAAVPDDVTISVLAESFTLFSKVDFFVSLNWALRFELLQRKSEYNAPVGSDEEPVNASFGKKENRFGFGLLYHFL